MASIAAGILLPRGHPLPAATFASVSRPFRGLVFVLRETGEKVMRMRCYVTNAAGAGQELSLLPPANPAANPIALSAVARMRTACTPAHALGHRSTDLLARTQPRHISRAAMRFLICHKMLPVDFAMSHVAETAPFLAPPLDLETTTNTPFDVSRRP